MSAPDHAIEAEAVGYVAVKVGSDTAGYLARDPDNPSLWRVMNPGREFMGRYHDLEEAAAFLAAWFGAEEQDWS